MGLRLCLLLQHPKSEEYSFFTKQELENEKPLQVLFLLKKFFSCSFSQAADMHAAIDHDDTVDADILGSNFQSKLKSFSL